MRSQTATEYLIILAVVIIIALIVITTLGGIPGIANEENTQRAKLQSAEIAITEYTVTLTDVVLSIRNNKNTIITINQISINNQSCTATNVPITLNIGQKAVVDCTNLNGSTFAASYSYPVRFIYTDIKTNAQYTMTPGNIIGRVAQDSSGSVTYKYLRWTITENNGNKTAAQANPSYEDIDVTGAAEFQLMLYNNPLSASATAFNPFGSNPGGQGSSSLVDQNNATNFLDLIFAPNGQSIVIINYSSPVTFNGYRYLTEPGDNFSDYQIRNPISWTLEGSDDINQWYLLATVDRVGIINSTSTWTQTFNVSTPSLVAAETLSAYQYFKWNITSVFTPGSYYSTSELILHTNYIYQNNLYLDWANLTWTNATVGNPNGSWPGGQEPQYLVDNNLSTKWLDWSGNNNSVLYIDARENISPRYYRYAPEVAGDGSRHPRNWTFWASTDNSTWTLLSNITNGVVSTKYRIQ